jgi:hypothetical protein
MGQSAGQAMQIEPTKFRVEKSTVSYDNMQLNVGNNPVNFAGTIGFDETLDMKVTLPWTIGGRTARVGKESTGLRITIPITGTISKYEIKIEKIIENVIPGLLDNLLKK